MRDDVLVRNETSFQRPKRRASSAAEACDRGSSDRKGVRGRGAPVKNLSYSASTSDDDNDAFSRGTKCLKPRF